MNEAARRVLLPPDAVGRLDTLLSGLWPSVSRRRLKAAFRAGAIRMAGRRVRASTLGQPGLEVTLASGFEASVGALPLLELVEETDALLVVEKPAGVPCTPSPAGGLPSIADALRDRYPELEGVGDLPRAPGLCHRLDLETSGLLLVARTAEHFAAFRAAFTAHAVEKVYLAVVSGNPPETGTCTLALGRRKGRGRRMEVDDPTKGRSLKRSWPASTHFRVLERDGDGGRALLEVRITTGVTHQIRAHLSSLGYPVLGDTVYGGVPAPRLALHAWRLALEDPISHLRRRWESSRGEAVRSLLTSP